MANFKRRLLCAGLAAGLLGVGPALAQGAGDYPNKPVKIIVPFTAGGLADTLARGIAQELSRDWGQQVIVENKPGANTIIAAQATATAPADGYTLMMANDPTVSSNQYLYSRLPYDPVKDFVPVVNVAETLEVLLVGPGFKGKTLQDLIAEAKANPGRVSYGTYGPGSKAHIDAEAFAQATGVKLLHVPYKGVADVIPALLSGQVQMAFTGVPPARQLVKSGQLRAIAIAAPKRSAALPDVPTFAEVGMPNFHSSAWFGLIAPAGTPKPVIDKVATSVARLIEKPDFSERYIVGVGLEPLNLGPDRFAEFLQKDRAMYAKYIKALGVKLD
ncbi:tripartite tricarboxylate transporter substrate binding protein [Ramlibacter sp. AW1]|uniref:Tripartite tricarboxylate transporter substrate binding protein n=1 Tax=Ramlibacter aurantiacus TaxID=2801330 RepID=A0A937D0F4_9BURK|nr:tripartite tricarboxylate transporter substrate binding protein [Ramlibacter aurantiacus]MBL0419374.1 tripartite tricarboxylate transporter substrate binding protein [Ramlibacter aurantiacus]